MRCLSMQASHIKKIISNPKVNGLMEKRIGIISIVIHDRTVADKVNRLISDYGDFILARQGLPLQSKGLNIITLIVETTTDKINALTGSLGRLNSVEVKTIVSKYKEEQK